MRPAFWNKASLITPFPSYKDMGFRCGRPKRSRARGVCAFIGAKRRPFDGEDGPHTLVSVGKGCRGSGYRSMPWSCAVCTVGAVSASIAWTELSL